MKILRLLAAACLLQGCKGWTVADAPALAPPPSLMAPCAAPVFLGMEALTDQRVEVLWGRDRTALRSCAGRHSGLTDWINGTSKEQADD